MTIIEKAVELIEQHRDFDEEVAYHFKNGYVLSTPTCFALAVYDDSLQELSVNFVVGEIKELLTHITLTPLDIKIITFEKNSKIKKYNYQKFMKRFNIL